MDEEQRRLNDQRELQDLIKRQRRDDAYWEIIAQHRRQQEAREEELRAEEVRDQEESERHRRRQG